MLYTNSERTYVSIDHNSTVECPKHIVENLLMEIALVAVDLPDEYQRGVGYGSSEKATTAYQAIAETATVLAEMAETMATTSRRLVDLYERYSPVEAGVLPPEDESTESETDPFADELPDEVLPTES